jgi:hypothetical protein
MWPKRFRKIIVRTWGCVSVCVWGCVGVSVCVWGVWGGCVCVCVCVWDIKIPMYIHSSDSKVK